MIYMTLNEAKQIKEFLDKTMEIIEELSCFLEILSITAR